MGKPPPLTIGEVAMMRLLQGMPLASGTAASSVVRQRQKPRSRTAQRGSSPFPRGTTHLEVGRGAPHASLRPPRGVPTTPRAGHRGVGVAAASSAAGTGGGGDALETSHLRCLVIGGTGRIGTAAAIHLLQSPSWPAGSSPVDVALAGRDPEKGARAVEEVRGTVGGEAGGAVRYEQLDLADGRALRAALGGCDVVLHTAGPYEGDPELLAAAIECGVPCYVDLADPLPYLDAAVGMSGAAEAAGTCAVCSAGAFPGLSNVLASELAARLTAPVQDLTFSYYTAGLGGSGVVNLLITNLGFGEPVPTWRGGRQAPQLNAGLDQRFVDFFLDPSGAAAERVGKREVWAWPFPEVSTVAGELGISGDSDVRMGTAPGFYNKIMSAMVSVVPREWWRARAFSQGLADFSEPLVKITDPFVGETHAVRVDVVGEDGSRATAVQAHESFRSCVGQSAAEFALDMASRWDAAGRPRGTAAAGQGSGFGFRPGVYLPEGLYRVGSERSEIVHRLTSTPGTIGFETEVSQ